MQLTWNEDKNRTLKANAIRGVCFEDIAVAVADGRLLDDIEHPNQNRYPGQRMLIVLIERYVYAVPYVKADDVLFLKTAFPSRDLKKIYLPGESNDQRA